MKKEEYDGAIIAAKNAVRIGKAFHKILFNPLPKDYDSIMKLEKQMVLDEQRRVNMERAKQNIKEMRKANRKRIKRERRAKVKRAFRKMTFRNNNERPS